MDPPRERDSTARLRLAARLARLAEVDVAARGLWPVAQQAFLRARRDQLACTRVEAPAREAARARRDRALLRVEQPVVEAEGPVEPHGVVEAGGPEARRRHADRVRLH